MRRLKNILKLVRLLRKTKLADVELHSMISPVINNGGGHLNHASFLDDADPERQLLLQQKLAAAIDETFGSF